MFPRQLIEKMSLKDKLGQLLMVGFNGQEVTPEVRELIEKYQVGGVIFFSRNLTNPRQAAKLSRELQKLSLQQQGIPLFIAADEEGGSVTRVVGMTHFPGAMAQGAVSSPELTARLASAKAAQLKYLGINFNLAPVLDVNNNPDNPIIGNRSFGSDPGMVAELGQAYLQGLQQEGVLACGKHFPGHGDTAVDSHLELPVIKHAKERMDKVELRPFKIAITAGIDSIMTAHIAFPGLIDDAERPATVSPEILTGFLRNELGFEGLIITDCMEMDGIRKTRGTIFGALESLQAGSDQILVSHSRRRQIEVLKRLEQAVRQGDLSQERINRSLIRILTAKQQRLDWQEKTGFSRQYFHKLHQQGDEIAEEVSARAITLLADSQKKLPLSPERNKEILLLDLNQKEGRPVENQDNARDSSLLKQLKSELSARGINVRGNSLFSERGQKKSAAKLKTGEAGAVMLLMSDLKELQEKSSCRSAQFKQIIESFGSAAVIICTGSPYYIPPLPPAPVLVTYDSSPAHAKPLVRLLLGEEKFRGRLPVEIK